MANAGAVNQETPERSILKVALTALAGSSIEWYDFFIYGTAAALVFPGLFFPGFGDTAGTILSYSTFAVGFVARPVGGLIFGHFGDKFGRKRALVTALILMGIGTTTIGLMPGYATIGILAPILLVTLRFLQGVCIGGQWGGAVLLATESAPSEKRGFYGSFAQMGVPVAVLISNIIFLIIAASLGDDALVAWAWRIPFLLSVLLIGLGLYIQLKLEDTPAFRHLQEYREQHQTEEERREAAEAAGSPVWEVLKTYPKEIALAAGAFIAINANFYILITYILDYATAEVGLPQSTVLTAVLISSVAGLMAIAGFAALSDVIGRRIPYMAGAVLLGLWGLFAFWPLVDSGNPGALVLALVLGQVFLSMMYGPQAAFYSEIFTTRVRYSGASMGYQIGSVFGGALAPIIATSLLAATGTSLSVGVYMAVVCAITGICAFLLAETYGRSMDETSEASRERGTDTGVQEPTT
ncbi:MAG: MHS family MFS transporter [Actinomycetota bacterium]|jgi:metabolite-proton symporter|nr:MHS family MFS transporter [Actinomycetota bacterium]